MSAQLLEDEIVVREVRSMKIALLFRVLGLCLIPVVCLATVAMTQPQPVPNLRDRPLDKASYAALAKEWRAYIDKNGETADALVNLGKALRYSGEIKAAEFAGRRAVVLEPENPRALEFCATVLNLSEDGTADALRLLERCRAVAPDFGDGLMTLVATYLRGGALAKAREVSATIYEQRILSRPLQDFAYNMLVGLPEGAILVTNGDYDTFPPLSLQAGMNFRTDVVVVNRHLLTIPAYADSLISEHGLPRPAKSGKPEAGKAGPGASRAIIERWLTDGRAPVYFACTVDMKALGFDVKTVVEGLCLRAAGKGLTADETARLVLERYRLDSATDWSFAWDLAPAVSNIVAANYVASLGDLALQEGVSHDMKCRLLDKAAAIAEFHKLDAQAQNVKALLKKCETK
jgi:hypothetical protein